MARVWRLIEQELIDTGRVAPRLYTFTGAVMNDPTGPIGSKVQLAVQAASHAQTATLIALVGEARMVAQVGEIEQVIEALYVEWTALNGGHEIEVRRVMRDDQLRPFLGVEMPELANSVGAFSLLNRVY